MQEAMNRCAAWQEIYYDPNLGMLPSDYPDPWLIFYGTGSAAQITQEGKLRIIDTGEGTQLEPTGYKRIEPVLAQAPMYVLETEIQVMEVFPWVDPNWDHLVRLALFADGERVSRVDLGFWQGAQVAAIGDLSGYFPLHAITPWDWTQETTYSYLAERGANAYLEVEGQVSSVPYNELPPLNNPSITEYGFSTRGVVADFSYVRLCICTGEAPIVGVGGKIGMSNLTVSPDPFDPAVSPSQLTLDVHTLELPGQPSGQFDYQTRVTWELMSQYGFGVERSLVSEQAVVATGVSSVTLDWDGTNEAALDSLDGDYDYKTKVELVRTRDGGQTQVMDTIESPWRVLTLERAISTPPPVVGYGISIHGLTTSHSAERCFNVSLAYQIQPTTSIDPTGSFAITYEWDDDAFEVTGMQPRTLSPRVDGTFLAAEDLEVCERTRSSDITLFRFSIEALSSLDPTRPPDWFRKFASVPYVFGSEHWQNDLQDDIAAHKQQIDSGSTDPITLRSYWRLMGHQYHGGAQGYASHIQARLDHELPSSVTAQQRQAYNSLLLDNGGNIAVDFQPHSGTAVSINLNKSYTVSSSYQDELPNLFGLGLIATLLRLETGDSFELVREKAVGRGIMLRYQRVRENVHVVRDSLSVFIEPFAQGYRVLAIISTLGDLGDATCHGTPMSHFNRSDTEIRSTMEVIWSGKQLLRHEGHYRCVYQWNAKQDSPAGNGFGKSRVLVLDAHTGAVLYDTDGIKHDYSNGHLHQIHTDLAIPYTTSNWEEEQNVEYDVPTRLAITPIWAFGPAWEPALHNDWYISPWPGGFPPSDLIGDNIDHTDFRYLPLFHHKPPDEPNQVEPTINNFVSYGGTHGNPWFPYGLYQEYVDNLGYADYLEHTAASPTPGVISYHFDFTGGGAGAELNYAAAATATLYHLVQYSKHIWGHYGGSILPWTDAPMNRCSGDEGLKFLIVNEQDTLCRWSVGGCQNRDWIMLNSWNLQGKYRVMDVLAHEYGHFVGNVNPVHTHGSSSNNSAGAHSEANADYFVGSLYANWQVGASLQNQFDSRDPQRLYHGNSAYASIYADHHQGGVHDNSRVFSGVYAQLMSTIGSYYTDEAVPSAYHGSASAPSIGGCENAPNDLGGVSIDDYLGTGYEMHGSLKNASRLHHWYLDDPAKAVLGPNYVKNNTVEIEKAAAQHDWRSDFAYAAMEASADPSHARSITNSTNLPVSLNLAHTQEASEKWVNFFASAGVRYNLFAYGSVDQTIELYRVNGDRVGGYPDVVAWNNRCDKDAIMSGNYFQQLPGYVGVDVDHVEVEEKVDPTLCVPINGIYYPALTFTPKRSGWFLALVKGHSTGLARVTLEPATTQVTATNTSVATGFIHDREYRLGQTLPVNLTVGPKELRSGIFNEAGEYNFWKFQHYPAIRVGGTQSDMGDPTRPDGLFVSSSSLFDMRYVIRVVRPDDNTNLELIPRLTRYDGSEFNPPNPGAMFVKNPIPAPGPLPGLIVDEWTVSVQALNSGLRNQGGNVLIWLRQGIPGVIRPMFKYDIYVTQEHDFVQWNMENDTTSFQGRHAGSVYSGIYTVPRWCNGENIALTMESHQIAERLSPQDADFYQIWLEEGEHLNVTYRGQIPAALDVDGPGRDPDSDMSASGLNNFMVRKLWDGGTDHADHYLESARFANDYRPVLTDPSQLRCGDACTGLNCCGNENEHPNHYFAQRGYLWSYNICSWKDVSTTAPQSDLECPNTPWGFPPANGLYGAADITPDNSLHLSLTAFITGLYTIRVRSQDGNGVKLDGYWSWNSPLGGPYPFGAPYTLDFNLGVFINKARPHWQFLQGARGDLAPRLACSRYGVCGDGVKQRGEDCDDGNTADGDGCDAQCFNERPPIAP